MQLSRYKTLHEGFFENSKKNPESIAVVYEDERITYKDFSDMVRRTAANLRKKGISNKDKVVVVIERGPQQLATYIAIMSIGAVYIPVSIHQPLNRKQQIIEDSKADFLIESKDLSEAENEIQFNDEDIVTDENNSAYVIYTSGSTGIPKGVEMSHKAAMNTINEVTELFDIDNNDSILNVSSSDFDLSVFDFYAILSVGGTVVLIRDEDYRNPGAWYKAIKENGVTIWNSAPALMEMLSAVANDKDNLSSLRLAFLSGDWIPMGLFDKWNGFSKAGSKFVSLGGATEVGIWSNYFVVDEVKDEWVSIPYGKALPNQEFCIVSDGKVIEEPGKSGELWIGGRSLANGYINDEQKTNDKFVYDDCHKRWYKTGDLGQYFPDGNIEFLGRLDNQIKLRGHRIELGEIENKVESIEGVAVATAIASGDKFHKEIIVFYTGKECEEAKLADYLKDCLPEYSMPSKYIYTDSLPLNQNGKIDRRALEEKYLLIVKTKDDSDDDKNVVVRELEKLTGRTIDNLDEDVFKLGADSLTIAKFIERMRTEYNVTISFNTVFENPTVRDLADIAMQLIDGADGEEGEI